MVAQEAFDDNIIITIFLIKTEIVNVYGNRQLTFVVDSSNSWSTWHQKCNIIIIINLRNDF